MFSVCVCVVRERYLNFQLTASSHKMSCLASVKPKHAFSDSNKFIVFISDCWLTNGLVLMMMLCGEIVLFCVIFEFGFNGDSKSCFSGVKEHSVRESKNVCLNANS